MRLIYAVFILLLLALMTSAQCQQTAEDWFNKGSALAQQGKYDESIKCYDEAIKVFDEALRLDPKDAYTWLYKGNAFANQNKYDDAIKCYDEAIRLDPNYAATWEAKGWALYFQERYDEAAKAFGKIVEINPHDKVAWNSKGLALSKQEKYNEAIQAYDKAIELDPKFGPSWNNKGTALDKLGKYDEAIECSYTGLKLLNFTDRHYLFALGQAHYEEGNYAAAIRYYDEVITRDLPNATDPSNATVWYNKGLAFKALNRTTEANAAFAKYTSAANAGIAKTADVDKWIQDLKDPSPVIREAATESLGDLNDTRVVEPLIRALKDVDRLVRSNAAESLGNIGDNRAVEPLHLATDDEDLFVKLNAADALSELDSPYLFDFCQSDGAGGRVSARDAIAKLLGWQSP